MLLEVKRRVAKPLASQLCDVLPGPVDFDLPHMGVPAVLVIGEYSQLNKARLQVAPAEDTQAIHIKYHSDIVR